MKLYTAAATPFGRTVAIVARELGLDEDIEVVPVAVKPTEPNRPYRSINPLGRIPALEIEGGEVLVDSAVITAYLAARVGDTVLFADNVPERWRVASRYALARGAAECAVGARYELAVRPEEMRFPAWASDLTDKVLSALDFFEAAPPAGAGRLTIDDIALGALLGYLDFRFEGLAWRNGRPQLAEFMDRISVRESFRATAPK